MSGFGDLAAQVADAFGLGTVLQPMVEVAGGEQARVWRLETDRGSFAVKDPRRGCEPRIDGVDVAFQEAVGRQTDIMMSLPVRRPGRSAVVPVSGRLLRVSTWMELLPPDDGLDPAAVGDLLAALHTVDFEAPAAVRDAGIDPWFWAPVGQPRWNSLVERLTRAEAPFAGTLRGEAAELVELEAILEQPADLRLCHCDLWSDNVLRTTGGDICVIDWDNCGLADPSHELVCALFEFGQGSSERMRALYAAYRTAGGPASVERPGQATMLIAQFGHFWEAAAEEWLEPASTAADRAHAESRVAELMEPPLRVGDVEQLLAALR